MKKLVLSFFMGGIFITASAQWAGNTNLTPTALSGKSGISSMEDGSGGMFLVWEDTRNSATTGTDIYAQRISKNGTLLWAASGVQATNALGDQTSVMMCGDGAGGIFLAWVDPAGNQDIYIQRVNGNGSLLYGAGGIAFSANAVNIENRPTLALLNNSEALLMFSDNRTNGVTGNGLDVYANKVNIATGAKVFANDIVVSAALGTPTFFSAAPDGSGGAFMVWQDPRVSTSGADIFVERMNNNGTLQAGSNGYNITPLTAAAADNQIQPYAIGDGAGNVFVTWADQRIANTNGDIFVQKLNSSLSEAWTAKGVNICNAAGSQANPYLVLDGAGGIIVTWSDPRLATSNRDIYAQKVNSAGVPQWAPLADGVGICTAAGNQPGSSTQSDIFIVADGSGGAVIAWGDVRNGAVSGSSSNMDIYAQKINTAGAVQWAASGIDLIVPTGSGNQRQPVLVNDGTGNILAAWIDARSGTINGELYGAQILADGTLPLQFLNITGSISNNNIQVSFTTAQEQNLANLIIEKSAEGISFSSLTSVKPANKINGSSYQVTDASPLKGNNYYRVKAVDKDGAIHYSPIALVLYDQKISITTRLYPNPATTTLALQVTNAIAGKYALLITDISGRKVQQTTMEIANSLFSQNISLASIAKGILTARLVNEKGETVWVGTFVKE